MDIASSFPLVIVLYLIQSENVGIATSAMPLIYTVQSAKLVSLVRIVRTFRVIFDQFRNWTVPVMIGLGFSE